MLYVYVVFVVEYMCMHKYLYIVYTFIHMCMIIDYVDVRVYVVVKFRVRVRYLSRTMGILD